MISRILDFSVHQRWLVLLLSLGVLGIVAGYLLYPRAIITLLARRRRRARSAAREEARAMADSLADDAAFAYLVEADPALLVEEGRNINALRAEYARPFSVRRAVSETPASAPTSTSARDGVSPAASSRAASSNWRAAGWPGPPSSTP